MDERLRLLALTAARGDPQAEAHLLLTRVRNGDLDPARLERAADLGHEAASLAVGRVPAWTAVDPGAWPAHLDASPRWLQVRVAVALARLILWSASPSWPDRGAVEAVLRAAEDWTACPCDEHAERAGRLGAGLPYRQAVMGRKKARPADAALRVLSILSGLNDPPPSWVLEAAMAGAVVDTEGWRHFEDGDRFGHEAPFPRLIAMAQDAGADAALLRAALRDDVDTWLLSAART